MNDSEIGVSMITFILNAGMQAVLACHYVQLVDVYIQSEDTFNQLPLAIPTVVNIKRKKWPFCKRAIRMQFNVVLRSVFSYFHPLAV